VTEKSHLGRRARALVVALLAAAAACDRPSAPPSAVTSAPSSTGRSEAAAGASREPVAGEAAGVHYLEIAAGGGRADQRLPMVVVIHGLGDKPESYVSFLPKLRVAARVILPRGLEAYGGGWSWFAFRRDATPEELAGGIRSAADRLATALAEIAARRPTSGRPIVTGFSQGGMLSFALAVHHPVAIAAAYPMSGMLPAPLRPSERVPNAPPVIAFHGDADQLVPIGPAEETVAALKEHGWSAELRVARGVAHTVPPETRASVKELIESAASREAGAAP
jgi:phospholipase/carboxylesterase